MPSDNEKSDKQKRAREERIIKRGGYLIDTPLGRFPESKPKSKPQNKPKSMKRRHSKMSPRKVSFEDAYLTPEENEQKYDPLGVITPFERRDPFYDRRSRRLTGDEVRSQREIEDEAYRETYLTDEEEFKREIDEVSDFEEGVDYFTVNNFMGGSADLINRSYSDLFSGDISQPFISNDHLEPESHISQVAFDEEEYKGVQPSDRIVGGDIQRLRNEERDSDVSRVSRIVDEIELLSGGVNDSLMDGQDLVRPENAEEGKYDYITGFTDSALQRGRNAQSITDINLDDMESSLKNMFDVNDVNDGNDGDESNEGNYVGDDIVSSIKGLTGLSDQDGSWFSSDKNLEKNIDLNERLTDINKVPMNRNTQIGKYNPTINTRADIRLLMSQGVSLGTINQMRKNEINYKQPSRSFKNNAVDLIRMGNRRSYLNIHEFDP